MFIALSCDMANSTVSVLDTKDDVVETVSFNVLRANPQLRILGVSKHALEIGMLSTLRITWIDRVSGFKLYYDGFLITSQSPDEDGDYDDISIKDLPKEYDAFCDLLKHMRTRVENRCYYPSTKVYEKLPKYYRAVTIGNNVYLEQLSDSSKRIEADYFSVLEEIYSKGRGVENIEELNPNGIRFFGINKVLSSDEAIYNYLFSLDYDTSSISNCVEYKEKDGVFFKLLCPARELGFLINIYGEGCKVGNYGFPLGNMLNNFSQDLEDDCNNSMCINKNIVYDGSCVYIDGNIVNPVYVYIYKNVFGLSDKEAKDILSRYLVKMNISGKANSLISVTQRKSGVVSLDFDSFVISCKSYSIDLESNNYLLKAYPHSVFEFKGMFIDCKNLIADTDLSEFKLKDQSYLIDLVRYTNLGSVYINLLTNYEEFSRSCQHSIFLGTRTKTDLYGLAKLLLDDRRYVRLYGDIVAPLYLSRCVVKNIDGDDYICPYVMCITKPDTGKAKDDIWESGYGISAIEVPLVGLNLPIVERKDYYEVKLVAQDVMFDKNLLDYMCYDSELVTYKDNYTKRDSKLLELREYRQKALRARLRRL